MTANVISFASRLKGERADLVFLVVAKSKGITAWFITEVERAKKAIFSEAVKQDPLDLTKYGKVLYKGWGAEPPADIVAKLEEEYNQ